MKKSRIALIVSSCLCVVLASIVMMIAFSYTEPIHKHVFSAYKTYHISNSGTYYTMTCKDGCEVKFETKATLSDLCSMASSYDNIILDENITLTEEIYVQSFMGSGNGADDLDLTINLDLNNYRLSTNIDTFTYDSMFMFNANRGKIKLNIKNGKLVSQDLAHIFRLKNTKRSGQNIELNIDNVECLVSGVKTTPLFAHDCYNVKVNATNSRFISQTTTTNKGDYGVGAFINSDSEFNFNNCYFEGGDAVYVKSGTVDLTGCRLVNVGLVSHASQNIETFSAVGACLTADNYTTTSGTSKFEITIKKCVMESMSSFKMIYVIETSSESGMELGVNANSVIDVQSCSFNNNPTALTIPKYDLVHYPNGEAPTNNGTQTWTCGDMS